MDNRQLVQEAIDRFGLSRVSDALHCSHDTIRAFVAGTARPSDSKYIATNIDLLAYAGRWSRP